MKKYILIVIATILVLGGCSKEVLDTAPTSSVSGQVIFKDTESAMVALNGIYRILFVANNTFVSNDPLQQQNYGVACNNLVADLMGEDLIQNESGQGWFYWDYQLTERAMLTSSVRPYATWNFYYKIITNANYILASVDGLPGVENERKNIKGQALALRSYAYFYLTLFFQQTYVGNEDKLGVPLYTEPTKQGAARGTLRENYAQIDKDIDEAVQLLKDAGIPRGMNKSYIDYSVASAIQAKIRLVEERWADAATAAANARVGYPLLEGDDLHSGFNDVGLSAVLWGSKIVDAEAVSGGWGSLFCHLDPGTTAATITANGYGVTARKCIDKWLYDQIPAADERKAWWYPAATGMTNSGPMDYAQKKYYYSDITKYLGDYLYLRAEEMLLIEAEAKCHLGDFTGAKDLITELLGKRGVVLNLGLIDASTYSADTRVTPTTLMEEILLQRRIELWCEAGRLFDLKRLNLGYTRNYTESNHSDKLLNMATGSGSANFVLLIPQIEFDGNEKLNVNVDQNPL